jgi:hypothetical protein
VAAAVLAADAVLVAAAVLADAAVLVAVVFMCVAAVVGMVVGVDVVFLWMWAPVPGLVFIALAALGAGRMYNGTLTLLS